MLPHQQGGYFYTLFLLNKAVLPFYNQITIFLWEYNIVSSLIMQQAESL